jgi:hypothetical protein
VTHFAPSFFAHEYHTRSGNSVALRCTSSMVLVCKKARCEMRHHSKTQKNENYNFHFCNVMAHVMSYVMFKFVICLLISCGIDLAITKNFTELVFTIQ